MKINTFQYKDSDDEWEIEPITFNNLTLLVGASGVGKTRILRAIRGIKRISKGDALNGVEWRITFSIGNAEYMWEGKFEHNEKSPIIEIASEGKEKGENKPNVEFEKITVLVKNKKKVTLIERKGTALTFKGLKSTIPIKADQSVISLIPDPEIKKIEDGFKRIFYSDYSDSFKGQGRIRMIDKQVLTKYKTIDDIRNSEEDILVKLYLVFHKNKKIFNNIKNDFINVFPQIEDIKIAPWEKLKSQPVPIELKAMPFLQVKETGINKWIPSVEISAGMFRSLIHIIELYLSADGTIILIDEFENSLGVNCIDELTSEIKAASEKIQFIITSHHPYIINNISYNNWKIVMRKGSKISTQNASDFNFNKSKHEAFVQLLNLKEYKTGTRK